MNEHLRQPSCEVTMRARALLGAALLFAFGCKIEQTTPEERLEGSWSVMTSDGVDCALAVTFEADGVIEVDRFCTLMDGNVGAQATIGTFEVSADGISLRWIATDWTCADEAPFSERAAFELLGEDRLRLVLQGRSRTWLRTDPDDAPSDYVLAASTRADASRPGGSCHFE